MIAVLLAVLACKNPEFASLPDAVLMRFAPNDRFALIVREGDGNAELARYDLEARKASWTVPLSSSSPGVSIADGARRFVTVERVAGTTHDRITVHDASNGQRVAQVEREVDPSSPGELLVETRQRVALAENGSWLAVASTTALDVYALPGGERVLHESRDDRSPTSARFDAGSTHLAVAQRESSQPGARELVVLSRAGERWSQQVVLAGADEPAWTQAGLLVLRETGIDRWRDGSTESLLGFAGKRPLGFIGDGPRSARYAPDGRFALVELEGSLALADLERGRIVYERAFESGGSHVLGAAVGSSRAAVFLDEAQQGILVEIDLATGNPVAECSWGRLSELHRPFFFIGERPPLEPKYWPTLSATGRFLAVKKPEKGYRIHRLD